LTGLGAVRNTAKVTRGSSVVVVGCGGVGLNVVQGASLAGAATIVAVDTARDKLGVARSFGATHALPAGSAGLQEQIIELTAGRGADYVFVSVGSKLALDRSQRYLAPGGTLVVVGMPASGVTAEYDPGDLAARGQRILGSKMGSSRIHTDIPLLLDLYRRGDLRLDELISGRFPLQDINAAVAEVRDGNTLRNVITFE
ncbi:MAG: zinc-binding dehydrogenase, partial [Gammaproteobacteria bacterium]|nr:zinc-binding dehydrogenase [Gammaproteobacteria bacterium]